MPHCYVPNVKFRVRTALGTKYVIGKLEVRLKGRIVAKNANWRKIEVSTFYKSYDFAILGSVNRQEDGVCLYLRFSDLGFIDKRPDLPTDFIGHKQK